MINDKDENNSPDDDADFDEFEDDQDGDWDDLDDDGFDDEEAGKKSSAGKKTFVQKNFYAIVALIVLTGAGLAYVGLSGKKGTVAVPPQNVESPPDQAQLENGDALPPVPAADKTAKPVQPEDNNEALLPMPAPISSATDMADNNAPVAADPKSPPPPPQEAEAVPAPETAMPPAEKPQDFASDFEMDAGQDDAASKPLESLDGTTDVPPAEIPAPALQDSGNGQPVVRVEAERLNAAPETAVIEDNKETVPPNGEKNTSETVKEEAVKPEPVPEETKTAAPQAPAIDDKAVEELKTGLSEIRKEISGGMDQTAEKMTDLAALIERLEKRIDGIEKQQDKLASDLKESKNAPAPKTLRDEDEPQEKKEPVKKEAPKKEESKPKKTVTKPEPAKTEAKKPEEKKTEKEISASADWELRSAQPGKAVIAKQGSNDLQTVEVGQSVKGLGKVTAIGIENGKWTVRGDKGSVSQ